MRQAPDHRVTSHALAPAASTPPILTNNAARQHCTVWPNALARHFQAQVIQARERAQVGAIKGSIGHVEVFQVDGVGISIIERPRPLPGHDTPNPHPTPLHPQMRRATLSRQMARQHRFQHQIKRSRKARPRPGSSAYRKAKRRRKIPALTMRALVIIRLHREVTTDPPSLLVLLPPASSPLTRPGMFCVGSGISTVLDQATPSTYEVGRNHPR